MQTSSQAQETPLGAWHCRVSTMGRARWCLLSRAVIRGRRRGETLTTSSWKAALVGMLSIVE